MIQSLAARTQREFWAAISHALLPHHTTIRRRGDAGGFVVANAAVIINATYDNASSRWLGHQRERRGRTIRPVQGSDGRKPRGTMNDGYERLVVWSTDRSVMEHASLPSDVAAIPSSSRVYQLWIPSLTKLTRFYPYNEDAGVGRRKQAPSLEYSPNIGIIYI